VERSATPADKRKTIPIPAPAGRQDAPHQRRGRPACLPLLIALRFHLLGGHFFLLGGHFFVLGGGHFFLFYWADTWVRPYTHPCLLDGGKQQNKATLKK